MYSSTLLVLVFLMARGGPGAKRRRSSAQQQEEQPAEEVGSEYNPAEDSGRESDEGDWETVLAEARTKPSAQETGKGKEKVTEKGKGKSKEKSKGKGKGKEKVRDTDQVEERQRKRAAGITIGEPTFAAAPPPQESQAPIDPKRHRLYSSKQCVGERWVGVTNLIKRAPGFQALFENGNLHEICEFTEQTGYGLELIREFYMRAGHLVDTDGGPYTFTTMVRNVELTITPDTVASVLEMAARTDGVDYLHADFDSVRDWRRVLNAICVPDAENYGNAILSKDLRLEYRYLNFVVCYNIMPLANTKVIRWDRVLYMYLLGHPDIVRERNINLNIPFLIWKRMAREIKTASQKDRLPFPLLIMRILRLHEVDVRCSSYERSLGPISDTTMVKSHVQLHGQSPPRADVPSPASPPAEGSEASMTSVYHEQRRLSGEIAEMRQDIAKLNKKHTRLSRNLSNFMRLICGKLGCGSSEMPPPDTDSD